jgi:argininosuccinate lyase
LPIRDGRLKGRINESFSRINASIRFDKRLYREDIEGSIAYAKALFKNKVLDKEELEEIIDGLKNIEKEIEGGTFVFLEEDEDIHMNIERGLYEKIGETAYKLHTGRSRNEQIVLDERLFLIKTTEELKKTLLMLFKSIVRRAKENCETVIPSYTHFRQAQPVSLAHHFLAYHAALQRDMERFEDFLRRLKVMPLGSGAVAGSSIGIDREFLRKELGFEGVSGNSIDAVSTRDFIIEFEFICSAIMGTLSRIAEDLILFSSDEIGYIGIPDELATTSSLMPQKKNPDSLELIRGKTGRVFGNLISIMTVMKGIPYSYNRDLQEDKEGLFDTVDSTLAAIEVMKEVFSGLSVNKKRIKTVIEGSKDYLFATDLSDYLVKKGVFFRKAHRIIGSIVQYAIKEEKSLSQLTIEEYKEFDQNFEKDVYDVFNYTRSVNLHDVPGGTALRRIREEINRIEKQLR